MGWCASREHPSSCYASFTDNIIWTECLYCVEKRRRGSMGTSFEASTRQSVSWIKCGTDDKPPTHPQTCPPEIYLGIYANIPICFVSSKSSKKDCSGREDCLWCLTWTIHLCAWWAMRLADTCQKTNFTYVGGYKSEGQLLNRRLIIPLGQDRVRTLRDGRRVVLTDHVHEFLDWAKNYYDISVCSLGSVFGNERDLCGRSLTFFVFQWSKLCGYGRVGPGSST